MPRFHAASWKQVPAALLAALAIALSLQGRANAWTSPDEASIYKVDPIIDGAIIAASVATTIGIYTLGAGSIDVRCPCNPNDVNAFDRHAIGNDSDVAARISDVTVGLALLAPVALDWLALRQLRPYLEDLTVYAETIAVSGALLTIAKQLTQRPFPRTYAGDPSQVGTPNGYRSFYSGHTTLTFAALGAMAFTVGERHGPALAAWLLTLGVGASVAVERVAAGWHFPTDVIAGAAFGTALGVAIPALHLRRFNLIPTTISSATASTPGLALVGRWP